MIDGYAILIVFSETKKQTMLLNNTINPFCNKVHDRKNDDKPAHSWQAFSPITAKAFEKCSKNFPTITTF